VTLDDNRKLLAMFDETPIGNFLELEGDAEVIELVASRIGFKPDAYVADSYVEMQLARCIARGEPLTDMVFPPTKAVRRGKKKKK
jgi:adenylate cyclase class 2